MSGSSAIVAINALMLKRTRLPGIKRVTSRASVPAAASA
jgi:Cu2+-exporting ATPase